MSFYWVYDYPAWMLFIGLILFFMFASISSIFLLRHFTDDVLKVEISDNAIISEYMGVTGVFFGLVLGMVAVGSWDSYRFSQVVTATEASNITVFYQSVQMLDKDDAKPITLKLGTYVKAIIDTEWPSQQRGEFEAAGRPILEKIGQEIQKLEVETPRQELYVGRVNGLYFDLLKARRDRLQNVANSSLPASLWWVVAASTFMIISLSMLMNIRNVKLDIAINVLMSILTGSILGFIISMDNPYRGELSVSVDGFQIIYDQILSENRELLNPLDQN